jgi:hypothetical protein
LGLNESAQRSERVAHVGPILRIVALGQSVPDVWLSWRCESQQAKDVGSARVAFLSHQSARLLVEKAPARIAGALHCGCVEPRSHHALMLLMMLFMVSWMVAISFVAVLTEWARFVMSSLVCIIVSSLSELRDVS